jgi:tetratricopeptide (TPR) repeat protein
MSSLRLTRKLSSGSAQGNFVMLDNDSMSEITTDYNNTRSYNQFNNNANTVMETYEVTHEEYIQNCTDLRMMGSNFMARATGSQKNNQHHHNKGMRRLAFLNHHRNTSSSSSSNNNTGTQLHPEPGYYDSSSTRALGDNVSIVSDESKSLYAATVASLDTVKVSNKTTQKMDDSHNNKHHGTSRSNPWNKIKRRIMGAHPQKSSHTTTIAEPSYHDTSNHSQQQQQQQQHLFSNRGMLRPNHNSNNNNHRQRSFTEDPSKQSIHEKRRNHDPKKAVSRSFNSRIEEQADLERQQHLLDDSIRSRFDGMEVMYLGGAQYCTAAAAASLESSDGTPWDRPLECTFTGQPIHWNTSQIVSEMMWGYGTNGSNTDEVVEEPREIILEGYVPGMDGRWSVRIEKRPPPTEKPWWRWEGTSPSPPPPLQPAASSEDSFSDELNNYKNSNGNKNGISNSSSTNNRDRVDSPTTTTASYDIWNSLWGPNPAPEDWVHLHRNSNANEKDNDTTSTNKNDDPMMILAVRCSIPVDIDENIFMISSPEHIQAINEMTGLSLVKGDFDSAFRLQGSLLRGVSGLTSEPPPDLRFVRGATLHNLGMLHLLKGQFLAARETFQRAVDERKYQLPTGHPDIAVSLIRKAMACFAVGRIDESIAALEEALSMAPAEHITRAKIMNNLAVLLYHRKDYSSALKRFTKATAIFRRWIEGPVRRETCLLDTAVTLSNMGKIYMERGDYESATATFEESLVLFSNVLRNDHDIVLSNRLSFAMAKSRTSQWKTALLILQGCLRSQNARFGALSAPSTETLALTGILYARQGDYKEALKCFCNVRQWQKDHNTGHTAAVRRTRECIKAIESKLEPIKIPKDAKVWI